MTRSKGASRGPYPSARAGRVVGLDLAGSPRRTTGFCCLGRGLRAETQALHTDEEIRAAIRVAKPDVVAIDAPLFPPLGRSTIEDRSGPHLRGCDRELLRLGIRFFPVTLGPMRMLTSRGMRLRAELADAGIRAIECYPGAAQDLWGIPRKQARECRASPGARDPRGRGRSQATGSHPRRAGRGHLRARRPGFPPRGFPRDRPNGGGSDGAPLPGRLPSPVSGPGSAALRRSAPSARALAGRTGVANEARDRPHAPRRVVVGFATVGAGAGTHGTGWGRA